MKNRLTERKTVCKVTIKGLMQKVASLERLVAELRREKDVYCRLLEKMSPIVSVPYASGWWWREVKGRIVPVEIVETTDKILVILETLSPVYPDGTWRGPCQRTC